MNKSYQEDVTLQIEIDKSSIQQACKREQYVIAVVTYDPRSGSFRFSYGRASPVLAQEMHNAFDDDRLIISNAEMDS